MAIDANLAGISCVPVQWPHSSVAFMRPTSLSGPYKLLKLSVGDSEMVRDMYRVGILQIDEERSADITFSISAKAIEHFRDDRFGPAPSMIIRDGLHVCAQDERVTSINSVSKSDDSDDPLVTVQFEWEAAEPIPQEWAFLPGAAESSGGDGSATLQKIADNWEVTSVNRSM